MDNSRKEANGISINEMDYLQITSDIKESPRIQKTEYIRQQMLKRRAMEDSLMEHLKQEQSVIDSFRDQINDGLIQTEELSRYNQEFSENMMEQIYLLHGISKDKLEGMQECKNAFRRGYSIILFLLSAALTVLCGALHGFQSEICLLMLAVTGLEGAMLAQDNSLDHYPVLRLINRVLFPLLCPLMMTMFVCYELGFAPYEVLLPYIAIAGIFILLLSSVPYFIYDPYKGMGKHMRDAKAEIKLVEKAAKKEVSKNQRIRVKEEKKELAEQTKENRKQERIDKKEAQKNARNAKKEARRRNTKNAPLTADNSEMVSETTMETSAETKSHNTVSKSTDTAGKPEPQNITAETEPQNIAAETTIISVEAEPRNSAPETTVISVEAAAPEKSETESTPKSDAKETSNEETAKPEPPKKRRSRKKNPVIDIAEGAQNLAAQS